MKISNKMQSAVLNAFTQSQCISTRCGCHSCNQTIALFFYHILRKNSSLNAINSVVKVL